METSGLKAGVTYKSYISQSTIEYLPIALYRIKRSSQIDRSDQMKRLYRSRTNRVIAGVCGGIAEYSNIDPTVVRLLWLLLSLIWGTGIVAYIIAWIIIPEEP
jgi:phage shock protein C